MIIMLENLTRLLRLFSKAGSCLFLPAYGWTISQLQRLKYQKQEVDYPIDFVITWVDGSDPEWIKNKELYIGELTDIEENTDARYRDWGILHYWFRAVEKYAPWVRKVFFVTCGQKPAWLDLSYEKVVFVNHEDFIPEEYLPTFNSRTIEMNLWRINGLSEHFIYFNDDVLLNLPVKPEDFYTNGYPKLCSLAFPFYFHTPNSGNVWKRPLLNDIGIINDMFDIRQVIQNCPEKFFSYKYGRMALYNLRVYVDSYMAGMYFAHAPYTYLRSTFAEIWSAHSELMNRSCSYRFRNGNQVTVLLPMLWMIFQGKYEPVEPGYYGKTIDLNGKSIQRIAEILQSEAKSVCLNDSQNTDAEDEETLQRISDELHRVMELKFPDQSKFELSKIANAEVQT